MNIILLLILSAGVSVAIDFEKAFSQIDNTRKRSFAKSLFNVVQFPNVGCVASASRNGTCYTSSECSRKLGSAIGSCANGYGVCCSFLLQCGQTSSENCTYLTLGATTSPPISNCIYKLCPVNSNVCRIRLDFTVFDITGPVTSTVGAVTTTPQNGGAIGDCTADVFSVTSPGNTGTPEICGFNTGQHMIVDVSKDQCLTSAFRFSSLSTNTRQYDIKVTQYNCMDEMGGPPGCLQYFTGNIGTVSSFNFRTTAGAVTSTVTHLSNQFYSMCFRRNSGKCSICYFPSIPGAGTAIAQTSFGLSITTPAIQGMAGAPATPVDSLCSTDYLIIPNGVISAVIAGAGGLMDGNDRFCGRFLSLTAPAPIVTTSVCSGRRPFRITFRTDADELTTTAAASSDNNETVMAPGGIIGFSLTYMQNPCP